MNQNFGWGSGQLKVYDFNFLLDFPVVLFVYPRSFDCFLEEVEEFALIVFSRYWEKGSGKLKILGI